MIPRILGLALAVACGASVTAMAATKTSAVVWKSESVDLPYPGPHFSGQGAELLNPSCSTCHSSGLVEGQPWLPLATWKAEVLKMKNVFHAPVQDKDVDALAQILFERQKPQAK
jgi:cytochrome c5